MHAHNYGLYLYVFLLITLSSFLSLQLRYLRYSSRWYFSTLSARSNPVRPEQLASSNLLLCWQRWLDCWEVLGLPLALHLLFMQGMRLLQWNPGLPCVEADKGLQWSRQNWTCYSNTNLKISVALEWPDFMAHSHYIHCMPAGGFAPSGHSGSQADGHSAISRWGFRVHLRRERDAKESCLGPKLIQVMSQNSEARNADMAHRPDIVI